jgi:uncharacterized protein
LWPSPRPVTLTIFMTGRITLRLPIRPERREDTQLQEFQEPEIAQGLETTELREGSRTLTLVIDPMTGQHTLTDIQDAGRNRLEYNGITQEAIMINRHSISTDPLSAKVECEHKLQYERDAWKIRIHTLSTMTCDEDHFYVTNKLEAFEGEEKVFDNLREFKITRDHV